MTGFQPNKKRNSDPKILLIVAFAGLLFLLGALFLLSLNSKKAEAPIQISADQSTVLVPIAPIDAGTELQPALFKIESRPSAQVGEGYVKDVEQIKGLYAASYIAGGAPLHSAYVTTKRPVNQIQANIPDGYRAVTLGVDPTTSVEGWARPGAKVDVLLSSSVAGKPAIRVIVQNAKVLSAGMQTTAQAQDKSQGLPVTVTLLVTADEAGKIQLASSSGSLSLVLRGDEDTIESEEALTVNVDTILGREDPPYPTPVAIQGQVKIGNKKYQMVDGQLKEMP